MELPTGDQGATQALKELAPVFPIAYRALEGATQDAREFFDRHEKPIDPWLAPDLVRWHTKLYLSDAGIAVSETGDALGIECDDLANNGLSFAYGRYRVRVRKADEGGLPPPGPSKTLLAFYRQHNQLPLPLAGSRRAPLSLVYINVVILWDVDRSYALTGLTLCRPNANSTAESAGWDWMEPIPHPVESTQASDAAEADDVDDLDISLDEDATGTESDE